MFKILNKLKGKRKSRIRKVVRQWCLLSLYLFNIFNEESTLILDNNQGE